jgi:gamma-butyrobetaine dioxygenase
MSKLISIKNVYKKDKAIEIEWSNGEKSIFHYLWLRDNCPKDIHPTARERLFNIINVSENIQPESYKINNEGKLEIIWNEGSHTSHFEPSWLRSHCYTINYNKTYVSPYILWDKSLSENFNDISIECEEIMKSDKSLIKWLEILHRYGVSIVKNAPTEKNSGLKVLNRISHIRETFFGTPFEVINIPKPNNTAYTAKGLENHTDLPYFETPPGYQFLHCLINNAEGGMSSMIDGFKVIEYIKNNESKTFEILKKVEVKFINNDYTQKTIRIVNSPVFSLTKEDDYKEIRFNISQTGAINCSPELMEKFYKAYRRFAELLHSELFCVNFKLTKGDIFSFDNRRVAHGRIEYDSNSGHRHLQGYYMDRDEIQSRLNYLKKIEL